MIYKKVIPLTIITLISVCIFLVGFMPRQNHIPKEIYQVYLDGQKIGLINSKNALEKLIDEEQQEIKEKYNIDNVYAPNGLEIKKVITFNEKIESVKKIYDKIKDLESFTIKGYIIEINEKNNKKEIYVIDKKIFEEALDKTIKAFVGSDEHNEYVNENQETITTTGIIIENINVNQNIVIKDTHIAATENIYTETDDLTKYLLFGEKPKEETYIVKDGETIEEIAFKNKLGIEELLVANPGFNSADILLLEGQQVNVGLINPQLDVVETRYVIKDEEKKYETEIIYDSKLLTGISYVKQEGSHGLSRVTQRITHTNGVPTEVEILSSQELSPSVNKVIVRGDKYVSNVGISGIWHWPTARPYIITSPYGYRWGRLHAGIDISGTGYNSPIYAANNGVVEFAAYSGAYGHLIRINHNNGYYTQYAHLASYKVRVGQVVQKGQLIGGMGNSGNVVGRTGVHLHYEMWLGKPHAGGTVLNPMKYY